MPTTMYTLRNIITGQEHTVNEDRYKSIMNPNKWAARFELIGKRVISDGPIKVSFTPPESIMPREAREEVKAADKKKKPSQPEAGHK